MKRLLFFVFLPIFGCVHAVISVPVPFQFTDNFDTQRLELSFQNTYPYSVCLTPEMWPNSTGAINAASGFVYLMVEGRRFPMKDFNTGYCQGCSTLVRKGEVVDAFIPYSYFDLPIELYSLQKTIGFSPMAEKCKIKAK